MSGVPLSFQNERCLVLKQICYLLRVALFATAETSSWLFVTTCLGAICLIVTFFATLEAAFLSLATILAGFGTVSLTVAFFSTLETSPEQ